MSDPEISLIIGGAGTGKTTHLLGIMDKILDRGIDPYQIGFCSFTRAARNEAAERAASRLNESAESLERDGWFKTLHAICYQSLQVGKSLLSDNKESRDWIAEAIGEQVETETSEDGFIAGRSSASRALAIWDCCRNRLEPLEVTHERFAYCDENTPSLNYTQDLLEQYERNKWLDCRSDFTDLLGRFGGWKFSTTGMHEKIAPEGESPQIPVWFFDEAQDQSALSDCVARRLAESARWVYLVGDPFQAIFGFAGSDPQHFQSWPAGRRRVLDQTFRCPAEIQMLGERRLRECSDYWDRGIHPAPHEGRVEFCMYEDRDWLRDIKPGTEWMLIARTNYLANRLAKRLAAQTDAPPWISTGKGGSPWVSPVRNKAVLALHSLQTGYPITDQEWQAVTKQLAAGEFTRGTKSQWSKRSCRGEDLRKLDGLSEWGCTDELRDRIANGSWVDMIDRGRLIRDTAAHWGWDAIENPPVRIGTIHSVKGAEAPNVVLLTTSTHQVARGEEAEQSTYNEERRVEYVGITRARNRLIVCKERDPAYHMGIDERDVYLAASGHVAGVPF